MAKTAGREVAPAVEREVKRRREDACSEVTRLEHLLDSLPPRRILARAVLRWQIRRARAQCAANEART